jgi:hypothetical protein
LSRCSVWGSGSGLVWSNYRRSCRTHAMGMANTGPTFFCLAPTRDCAARLCFRRISKDHHRKPLLQEGSPGEISSGSCSGGAGFPQGAPKATPEGTLGIACRMHALSTSIKGDCRGLGSQLLSCGAKVTCVRQALPAGHTWDTRANVDW